MNSWNPWKRWLGTHRSKTAGLFLRARLHNVMQEDHRKLTRWLAKDSNDRDYKLMEIVWQLSGDFKGDPSIDHIRPRASVGPKTSHPPFLLKGLALALGVAALALVSIYESPQWRSQVSYATDIGEQLTVTLRDGSRILLNTASVVRVEYSPFHRLVRLDSGEATFEVAKNPFRPFDVVAPRGTARALGTRFDVFTRPGSLEVAIVEGTVAVQATGGSRSNNRVVIQSGQLATVSALAKVSIGTADLARITGRQVERLEFDNVSLAEATREFNHYSRKPVRAATAEISARRISGVFHASDTDTFVRSAARSLGLRAINTGDAIVLTSPDDTKPAAE
jgi:transmembrane sensor